jgi:hypothetical protein
MSPFEMPEKSDQQVWIRNLTSSFKDGTPLRRRPEVTAEIATMLHLDEREWLKKAKKLQHETLFYLIREIQTRRGDDDIRGRLMLELGERVVQLSSKCTRGRRPVDCEAIAMQVEMEILQLVMSDTDSSATEYLEVAFIQAVQYRAFNAVKSLKRSPESYCDETAPASSGGGEDDSPEVAYLQKDRIRLAQAAVKDPKDFEVLRLHHAEEIPIESTDESVEDLVRRTGEPADRIKYRMRRAVKAIRKAFGEEK